GLPELFADEPLGLALPVVVTESSESAESETFAALMELELSMKARVVVSTFATAIPAPPPAVDASPVVVTLVTFVADKPSEPATVTELDPEICVIALLVMVAFTLEAVENVALPEAVTWESVRARFAIALATIVATSLAELGPSGVELEVASTSTSPAFRVAPV